MSAVWTDGWAADTRTSVDVPRRNHPGLRFEVDSRTALELRDAGSEVEAHLLVSPEDKAASQAVVLARYG